MKNLSSKVWKRGFQLMLILVLLGMHFDAVVVFVTSQTLLFRLALAILWQIHIMSVSWHFISFTPLCQTVAGICKYDLGLVWSVNFTNFLVKFLADFWNLISLCGWAEGVGLTREGGCDTPMRYMPRPWGTCWRAGGCCCLGWTSVLQLWKIVK